VNVNLKMLLRPVAQKFNTFNTFTTFAIVTPVLDFPTLLHRQAPRPIPVPTRLPNATSPSPGST